MVCAHFRYTLLAKDVWRCANMARKNPIYLPFCLWPASIFVILVIVFVHHFRAGFWLAYGEIPTFRHQSIRRKTLAAFSRPLSLSLPKFSNICEISTRFAFLIRSPHTGAHGDEIYDIIAAVVYALANK